MAKRPINPATLFAKKYERYEFESIYKDVFGKPSKGGIWLIYGKDKNGKTWGALLLADMLSKYANVWYISAEQGTDADFQAAAKRAKIDPKNKSLQFSEYESIQAISERLKKRNAPQIVFIDNLSMYKGEITSEGIKELKLKHARTTFIMLAHEERSEPYTAAAVMAKKLAKVIIHVQGLAFLVGGRCPGGTLLIDEEKATLYHGTQITNT